MLAKLMVRGLLRHQRRGLRLFILLSLCCAAMVVLISFKDDFDRQYSELFIGLQTGHLQILPQSSGVFSEHQFGAQSQFVPTFDVTDELDSWVRAQPEVEEAAPMVTRGGLSFNLDSEFDSHVFLIAVPSDRFGKLFPNAKVLDGSNDLTWKDGDDEVPMLHARLQSEFGEKNADHSAFGWKDVKALNYRELDSLISRVKADFPTLFPKLSPVPSEEQRAEFFRLWSESLSRPDLESLVPQERKENYDYRLEDALVALHDNVDPTLNTFFRKRLFAALYPDDLFNPAQPILPGKSVTLQVPGLKPESALEFPKTVPAKYVGMVDILPLYVPNSFIDLRAFRHYVELGDNEAMSYVVRLKNTSDTPQFTAKLANYLASQGQSYEDLKIADYRFLGKTYLSTGSAFNVIISILVGLFVCILAIFLINLVMISMIQRRREIGTGIAMGLSNGQSIVLMIGEMIVVVTVSWIAGSLAAFGILTAAHVWGVPGMVFFPNQKLFLSYQWIPFVATYALLIPTTILASWIPLSKIRNLAPVDFFREGK